MNYVFSEVRKSLEQEKIFICAPFFNEMQMEYVVGLEQLVHESGHAFWSARRQHGTDGSASPKIDTREKAKPVYDANIRGLKEATMGLVVLDWLFPTTGEELRVVRVGEEKSFKGPLGIPFSGHLCSPRLFIPDSGTVFEMGFLASEKVPMVGLLLEPRPRSSPPLNLMLTQALDTVFLGLGPLREWLRAGANFKDVKPWEGGGM